jgi:methylated-DNA-protein-cysteine methyltransferase related protein
MNKQSENFFEKVYEIVAKIPEGNAATYGQIALILGRPYASRSVG